MSELANVELNIKEIMMNVIENIVKMFHRRGYTTNQLSQTIIDKIMVDKTHNFELNGKKINIYILNHDLKNISAGSTVDDYLNKNIDYHKFLIVKSFTKKTYTQIIHEYKNSEIFLIDDFLEDIPAKEFIPEHHLLNSEEKKELLESFGLNELGRIYNTEIISRYYGAKIDDIFRIIRPNISSGTSIAYRLVINGSMDIFS